MAGTRTRVVRAALTCSLMAATPLLPGCGSSDGSGADTLIVTTAPVFSLIAREVAGTGYDVRSLLPAGESPHTFRPRPSKVKYAMRARVLIYGAPNLDQWAARIEDIPKVALLSLVPDSLLIPAGAEHPNPHFWMDPLAVSSLAGPLAESLCAVDPDECDGFRSNAQLMVARLDSVGEELATEMSGLSRPAFVVSHPFLDYFANRVGLNVVNIVDGSGNMEPSVGRIARLVRSINAADYAAVIMERSEPSPSAQAVAEMTGLPLISVDPLAGDAGLRSYIDFIESIADRLRHAAL